MAFVPTSSFATRWRNRLTAPSVTVRRPLLVMANGMNISDGMDFFRHREGRWESWRVTHHLAFRRSESGESAISMECLEPTDERILNLCKEWDVEPAQTQGGCYVTWKATLDWDQEGENHEGETIFALVPDSDDKRKGRILRDRGYAEVVPIAGTYHLDSEDDLNLETPYEGGAVLEKFSFDGPDVVNRLSTVKRFGGYSTSTFATERRVGSDTFTEINPDEEEEIFELMNFVPFLAVPPEEPEADRPGAGSTYVRKSRWGTPLGPQSSPPANSAFGSGFGSASPRPSPTSAFSTGFSGNGESSSDNKSKSSFSSSAFPSGIDVNQSNVTPDASNSTENNTNVTAEDVSNSIEELATKAGIDLSKIPPSMRADFLASFKSETKEGSGE